MPGEVKDAPVGPNSRVPVTLMWTILVFITVSVVAAMDRLSSMDTASVARHTMVTAELTGLQVSVRDLENQLRGNMTQDQFTIYMLKLKQVNPNINLPTETP